MTKTTIKATEHNRVELQADDPVSGERVHWTFFCPPGGGYVRRETHGRHGTLGEQVCTGLSNRGWTLEVRDPAYLLSLIRREWQRRRRIAASERLS